MARTGQPAHRHVAAVTRALAVLDALADGEAELGTNELARRTGINASTVSRLLATLAGAGLVERVAGTGRYRLGLRLVQLGNAALERLDLRAIARPHLRELVAITDETATLSAPGERNAVTIDFVQSPSSVQSVARVGRPSVAHATSRASRSRRSRYGRARSVRTARTQPSRGSRRRTSGYAVPITSATLCAIAG